MPWRPTCLHCVHAPLPYGGLPLRAASLRLQVQELIGKLHITKLEARDETSIDVMGCLNDRAQQTVRLKIDGDCAAARDAVGRLASLTLRKLQGTGAIFEFDIAKLPRFLLVTAQQKYMAVRPEGIAPHVHFRHIAAFSVAIMMAQAYELVNAYGCGSCLAFLETYLGGGKESDVSSDAISSSDSDDGDTRGAARGRDRGRRRSHNAAGGRTASSSSARATGKKAGGGRKEDGRMVQQERMSLFTSQEFTHMIGLVQKCEHAPRAPNALRICYLRTQWAYPCHAPPRR
jgi:hypothetical protein